MSSYLCVHVWDEIDDALPNGAMIFHLLLVFLFESVQNRGRNGSDGKHNVKDLQEMGKDCYRGDLFIHIYKCVAASSV